MMTLLHKYQRAITIIISVCVVSTFIFFGTSRAFVNPSMDGQDEIVYSYEADGKKISLSRKQMRERALFLSSEIHDGQDPREVWSAVLNLGFISEFILETGLGELLLEKDALSQAWLKEQWQKESRWNGYRHPQLAYLNYGAMLSQMNPNYYRLLREWQQAPADHLARAKIALWLQSRQIPFQAIRTLVRYQEKAASVAVDTSLNAKSMQPFGYHSLQDWFGPRFSYLCVELISQGAQKARSMGYEVSSSQVELMLNERLEQLWKSYEAAQPGIAFSQFKQQLLKNIGMEYASLLELWTDVALFERLCFHEGGRFLTESLINDKMAEFLADRTQVTSYELPQEYQVRSLRELAQLQLYWHLASALEMNSEQVPSSFVDMAKLTRTCPELVAKSATLNVRHLTLEQVRRAMGLKQLLTLEAQDKVWEKLALERPSLVGSQAALSMPLSDRLAALSALNAEDREPLDRLSLRFMIEHAPENLRDLLMNQEPEEKLYQFPLAAARQPLDGIANARELFQALQAQTLLCPYTQDGYHFYAIELKSEVQEERLSFAEAKSSGILEGLVTKRLQQHYETMKTNKVASILKEGQVQPFKSVQEVVIADLFQGLLVKLQKQQTLAGVKAVSNLKKPENSSQLVAWRFNSYLKEQQGKIDASGSLEADLPWSLKQTSPLLSREEVLQTPLEAVFKLKPGEWLPLVVAGKPTGRLVRCNEHSKVDVDPFTLDDQVHEIFSRPLDRLALKAWFESLTLDLQLDFLQRP